MHERNLDAAEKLQGSPAELWLAPACHSHREALDANVWSKGCQTWSACADRHDPVRYLRADILLPLLEVIEASRQLLPKAKDECPCGTCQCIRLRDGVLAGPQAAGQKPTPGVSELVEALEDIGAAWHGARTELEFYMRNVARAALAAYYKQGGSHDGK